MTPHAPILSVRAIAVGERPTPFRLPFQFGAVTVTQAPQAFVQVTLEDHASGRTVDGFGAELMVPKWFDKSPNLTPADTINQLRFGLGSAVQRAGSDLGIGTAAELVCQLDATHRAAHPELPGLSAQFGPAVIARAVVDGLCRLVGLPFADATRTNAIGLTQTHLPDDLHTVDVESVLDGLQPVDRIAVRHTVGLADPISTAEIARDPDDGLPVSLDQVIQVYGHRYFKLKLSGQIDADLDRLSAIAAVFDPLRGYHVTLDGNEQFADAKQVTELLDRMAETPALARLLANTLYLEQPIERAAALNAPLGALTDRLPVIIDESDADTDAFIKARALGYRGISSKACKGVLRSLVSAMRLRLWADGTFLSAEDLTTQAGLGLQQDLALVGLLGLSHGERNGHHFVGGMAGAPTAEQDAYLDAHPDLYRRDRNGQLRLRIEGGALGLSSLACVGFGSATLPDMGATDSLPPPVPIEGVL